MSNLPKKWPPVVITQMQSIIDDLLSMLEAAHANAQLANGHMHGERNVAMATLPAAKEQHVFTFTFVDGRVFQVAVSELAGVTAGTAN